MWNGVLFVQQESEAAAEGESAGESRMALNHEVRTVGWSTPRFLSFRFLSIDPAVKGETSQSVAKQQGKQTPPSASKLRKRRGFFERSDERKYPNLSTGIIMGRDVLMGRFSLQSCNFQSDVRVLRLQVPLVLQRGLDRSSGEQIPQRSLQVPLQPALQTNHRVPAGMTAQSHSCLYSSTV